jgi:formylglycine-generating enzyme required for sulfatase activity
MNCSNCGNFIRNPLNFCPYCRHPLNAVAPLLIKVGKKPRPLKGILFVLILLIAAFMVYRYKGQELISLANTTIFKKDPVKGLKTLLPENATAPQKGNALSRPPEKYIDPTTAIEFVFIPGGCYLMGDVFGDGDVDEKPVHEVCINDFYMSRYEVAQGQWEKLMGKNPSTV